MFTSRFSELVYLVLTVGPLLAVYIIGAVFAYTHRRWSPQAAGLVIAAVALLTFALIAQAVGYAWLATYLEKNAWSDEQMMLALSAFGFFTSGVSAAGIFLLILSAFTERRHED
jgi:hypothetical protein